MKNAAMTRYYRTEHGAIARMYFNQRHSSKKRGHEMPSYTKAEFQVWVQSQPHWKSIFNAWVTAGYPPRNAISPSVDRLDDRKPYSIDNIQLTTWGKNFDKYVQGAKAGKTITKYQPVECLDMEGNVVAEYFSVNEAARQMGVTPRAIRAVADGVLVKHNGTGRMYLPLTCKGHKWRYK